MKIIFTGNLPQLLRRQFRGRAYFQQDLGRKTSVKDVIESFGIPHTEVGQIKVNEQTVSFGHHVDDSEEIEVYPVRAPVDVCKPTLLRPKSFERIAFAVDINVAKLTPLLRMAGFDVFYRNYIADAELAEISRRQERILLSKDKGLLMRKDVVHGYLVRQLSPEKQLTEVVRMFGLRKKIKPFSRCLLCNGMLRPVHKDKIIDQLEPLTIKYFDHFQQCDSCGKIYWAGSHRQQMLILLRNCCGYLPEE